MVHKNQGFSLVELMVTLSIMGTLSMMAIPTFKNLMSNAKSAEAVTNTRILGGLIQAYIGNDGNTAMQQGSTADFSSDTSCQRSNAVGFRIGNCRRSNYVYVMYTSAYNNYSAVAYEAKVSGRKLVYPNCAANMDVWLYDGKSVYHPGNPRNTCLTCYYTAALASLPAFIPEYNFAAVQDASTGAESIGFGMYFSILSSFMIGAYATTCT